MRPIFCGIDIDEHTRRLREGVDHHGEPIDPFVDSEGGWPLRCCLADSLPGERVAIIGWTLADIRGAYRETGPIAVHAEACRGIGVIDRLPAGLDARQVFLRPYDREHRILYDAVTLVPDGASNTAAVEALLMDSSISFVLGRNYRGGCYAFTGRRDL